MRNSRSKCRWLTGRLALALGAILCGCQPASAPRSHQGETRRLMDSTGREVVMSAQPRRVLSLCTSATDTMVRLGLTDRLAGMDEYSAIVPGASQAPVLGKGSALSREQVLARRIDLAFVWWFQDDAAKLLEELGVPVVRLRCGRATEVPETLRLIGQCLNAGQEAEILARTVEDQLASLVYTSNPVRPGVYLELYSPFKTSGRESYLNDLIELAGGRNIASGAAGAVLLSSEQLLAADPQQVILLAGFGTPEQFARRAGLDKLSAVKEGRIQVLDRYYLVAGAGLPEGVAALHRLLNSTAPNKP